MTPAEREAKLARIANRWLGKPKTPAELTIPVGKKQGGKA